MDSYGIRKMIDGLGRITLPKSFRDDLGMGLNSPVTVCRTDDGILIKRVEEKKDDN